MIELAYGIHAVQSILDSNPHQILKIYVIYKPWDNRLQVLLHQAKRYNISFQECARQYLTYKVKGAVHQGIVAKIIQTSSLKEDYLLSFLRTFNKIPLFLVLDGIIDPHNLGACLRSADAAGVHMVIVPRHRSVHINSTVRKVSSGASERVPFVTVTNLSRTLRLLKEYNFWVVGTVIQTSHVVFRAKFTGALALVMGSEKSGIRQLTRKNCDELINIPMKKPGSSLNVSVATGICLFEIVRQRQYQNDSFIVSDRK